MKATVLFVLCALSLSSQTPPGLNIYSDEVQEGYVLVNTAGKSHLINTCGAIVHTWTPDLQSLFFHTKLLSTGELMAFETHRLQCYDWDGNRTRGFTLMDPSARITYEAIEMKNGNFLTIGRRAWASRQQIDSLGYRGIANAYDYIMEVDPIKNEVVWEWEIKDHMFQSADPTLPNYGEKEDNIDRLDVVTTYPIRQEELFMINGFDYNEELDLIIVSLRKTSEVAIIDHSTTTEEAKGSTGGNYGKGGRILYRWGNPQEYGLGDFSDQQLNFQHNPNWIKYGPYKDHIMVFDNINLDSEGKGYSQVEVIELPLEGNEFKRENNAAFEPELPSWQYTDTVSNTQFYSQFTSGAVVMPNGNAFVTEGAFGRLFEVNPNGDIVWQYTIPRTSFIFRTEKYASDYPPLLDKELLPMGTLESPSSSVLCEPSSSDNYSKIECLEIRYENGLPLITSKLSKDITAQIINIQGQAMSVSLAAEADLYLNNLTPGIYCLTLSDHATCVHSAYKIVVP